MLQETIRSASKRATTPHQNIQSGNPRIIVDIVDHLAAIREPLGECKGFPWGPLGDNLRITWGGDYLRSFGPLQDYLELQRPIRRVSQIFQTRESFRSFFFQFTLRLNTFDKDLLSCCLLILKLVEWRMFH